MYLTTTYNFSLTPIIFGQEKFLRRLKERDFVGPLSKQDFVFRFSSP